MRAFLRRRCALLVSWNLGTGLTWYYISSLQGFQRNAWASGSATPSCEWRRVQPLMPETEQHLLPEQPWLICVLATYGFEFLLNFFLLPPSLPFLFTPFEYFLYFYFMVRVHYKVCFFHLSRILLYCSRKASQNMG